MTDDYTQPEIVRALARIEEGQKSLGDKVDRLTERFVTADVFELRVANVERDIKDAKDASAAAQSSADARRTPGWSIAAVVASIVAVAASIIPALAK